MKRYHLRSSLLGCFALLFLCNTAVAQQADTTRYYQYYRADDTFYLKGRLGLNFYGGDRDVNPGNEIQKYIENIGFSLGLELGYAFSDRFSLGLMHLSGQYPRIQDNRPDFPQTIDQNTSSKWRHHFSLIGRSYMLPRSRVTPYGQLGFNVSFGKINDETRSGIGPIASVGLDAAVSDRVGIFLELTGIFDFDDDALDLADTRARQMTPTSGGIDASDFDAFTFFGFGVRLNFKSPIVPVTVDCTSPESLKPGEAGTFAVTTNENATRPVTFQWDFGDGSTGFGRLTSHAFSQPGTKTVTVTASNRGGEATARCTTLVIEPPACRITATPPSLSMCELPLPPVQFRSTVTGTPPITYQWDFGDGASSTEADPAHTYTRVDAEPTTKTFRATLRVSNDAGASTCNVDVNVEPCPCAEDLLLGCTFFDRNASVLNEQARRILQDNLDILLRSPSTLVFIEGYATANERNAATLAIDRARAVAQFYLDGGLDPSRVQTAGTVLEERPKSGVPCTSTIPYCDEQTLQSKREQKREEVRRDLRQQQQQ